MRFAPPLRVPTVLIGLGAVPGHAKKRGAFVVGINRYANLDTRFQLKRAINDAEAMGEALSKLGFDVIRGNNPSRLVRDDVLAATGRKREPFAYGSLPGEDFFFVSGK
jgi:hypothetical protein